MKYIGFFFQAWYVKKKKKAGSIYDDFMHYFDNIWRPLLARQRKYRILGAVNKSSSNVTQIAGN